MMDGRRDAIPLGLFSNERECFEGDKNILGGISMDPRPWHGISAEEEISPKSIESL